MNRRPVASGMRHLILALAAAALLSGCPTPVTPKPAPVPKDTDKCLAAEQNLQKLQCKDRAGDPMWVNKVGEPFSETCRKAQEEGRIFLNPACVAGAQTCEAANKCPAEGM